MTCMITVINDPVYILHAGNINTVNEPSKVVLDLKKFIKTLRESNVVISNLIAWTDNNKAFLTQFRSMFHLRINQVVDFN